MICPIDMCPLWSNWPQRAYCFVAFEFINPPYLPLIPLSLLFDVKTIRITEREEGAK